MKVPAIVLAVVLSAASLCGQALVDYAGATAASGSAATGTAKGINPAAGLSNKMAAAMGDTATGSRAHAGSKTEHTDTRVQSNPHSGVQSSAEAKPHCKNMKSDPHMMPGKQCKEMHADAHNSAGKLCNEMHGGKAGCCRKSKDGKMAHEMDCCKHGKCPHEEDRTGKEGTGKEVPGKEATRNENPEVTFVGAK